MLRLYLDDAGSQDNKAKPFFAVGGYIAHAQTWESLSVAWQKGLDEMHAPPYHATDCEPDATGYGHGDFKKWNTAELLELKKKLAPLTHQLSAGVGRGLHVPDHNEHLLNDPYFRNRVDDAKNYLPLFLVLEAALDWIASAWPHRPQGEKISVVFESGTKGIALAGSMFMWLRQHMQWAAKAYTETLGLGRKDDPCMQAADMLAFEAYKDLEGKSENPPRRQRLLLSELRRHDRLSFTHVASGDYSVIRDTYLAWEQNWRSQGGA